MHLRTALKLLTLKECHGCNVVTQELAAFNTAWDGRVAEFEAQLLQQTEALNTQHTAMMATFLAEAAAKRPQRPKHSAEYLNNRKIEEKLVKQVGRAADTI